MSIKPYGEGSNNFESGAAGAEGAQNPERLSNESGSRKRRHRPDDAGRTNFRITRRLTSSSMTNLLSMTKDLKEFLSRQLL